MPKSSLTIILRRVLDVGMIVCVILVPVIALTGGYYKGEILGVSVTSTGPHGPIKFLVPLLLVRFAISVELKNFLLVLGSLLIGLVLAEIVLRVWDAPVTQPQLTPIHQPSPVLDWDLVPGASGVGSLGEGYRINSAGCRDVERTVGKPSGVNRIVAIGDSFTFGMGVDLDDTYPKQLQRILNRRGMSAEVINCGVIAHNMWQHVRILQSKVFRLTPDVVILGIFEDDVAAPIPPPSANAPDFPGHDPFERKGIRGSLRRSYVYNFVSNMEDLLKHRYRARFGSDYVRSISERRKTWGPANPTDLNYRTMAGRLNPQIYSEFKEALRKFVDIAAAADTRVLVVMIPDSVQLGDPHMQAVNRTVRDAAEQIGVPFLDVTPVLEREDDPGSLYLFPVDAHNSPKGLRVIAEAIAAKLVDAGIVPSTSEGIATRWHARCPVDTDNLRYRGK